MNEQKGRINIKIIKLLLDWVSFFFNLKTKKKLK